MLTPTPEHDGCGKLCLGPLRGFRGGLVLGVHPGFSYLVKKLEEIEDAIKLGGEFLGDIINRLEREGNSIIGLKEISPKQNEDGTVREESGQERIVF